MTKLLKRIGEGESYDEAIFGYKTIEGLNGRSEWFSFSFSLFGYLGFKIFLNISERKEVNLSFNLWKLNCSLSLYF